MKRRAFLLASLALLSACSTPYHPPRFPDEATTFPGLIELAAAQPGHPLDVLLVHGMCSHDASWAASTVAELSTALQANIHAGAATPGLGAGPAQVQIVPVVVDTPAASLRIDAMIWSPLTRHLKQQLCYDQSEKTPLCAGAPPFTPVRPRLNARVKDRLVDDCLPDALIYQGVARDSMQQRMREAILRSGALQGTAPLVVITESMGSKILFDTLLRMSEETGAGDAAALARQTVDRMRYLVMAANQIPLLGMADQPLEDGPAGATLSAAGGDSLQQLLRKRTAPAGQAQTRAQGAATVQPLVLLAFSDPGDVLTYTLQTEKYSREGVRAFNVLVSNAPTWLGSLERPDAAHFDYLSNPDVGRLIVCGRPASARCRPE